MSLTRASSSLDLMESYFPSSNISITSTQENIDVEKEVNITSIDNTAPYVCDSLSSPLTPLMIQTDYIRDSIEENSQSQSEHANKPNIEEIEDEENIQDNSDIQPKEYFENDDVDLNSQIRDANRFYVRTDIEKTNLVKNIITQIDTYSDLESVEESDSNSDSALPEKCSLTTSIHKYRQEFNNDKIKMNFNPYIKGKDYCAPNLGPSYQCSNIPELLTDKDKSLQEQRNRTLEPILVYSPPMDKERFSTKSFQKMVKILQDVVPNIRKDKLLQVYFQNNYDEFETISQVVKTKDSLTFCKPETFTQTERRLFEIGLREFGKDYDSIQKLIKSKTLEEVITYYFFWKVVHSEEFLKTVENELPDTKILRRSRAKLILERLKRDNKCPKLAKFKIDCDIKNELYPHIPDPFGAYIKGDKRIQISKNIPTPQRITRKRTNPFSVLLPPTKKQRIS